jgi:hypothetical protein
LLDISRRVEWALAKNSAAIERDGDAFWNALANGGPPPDDFLFGVLEVAQQLDRLGDVIAEWAVDIDGPRPDAAIDRVVADAARNLDALKVPRQEPPPGVRNRG